MRNRSVFQRNGTEGFEGQGHHLVLESVPGANISLFGQPLPRSPLIADHRLYNT